MPPSNKKSAGGSGVGKVLGALVYIKSVYGQDEAAKKQVQRISGVSDATLPSLLSRMVKTGLLEYGSGPATLKITSLGEGQAGPLDLPTSDEEKHEEIKKSLKGKALRIFEYLADGEVHKQEDVMEAVACTNPKTFKPLVSRALKTPGWVTYPGGNTIQLSDARFPFSRGTQG